VVGGPEDAAVLAAARRVEHHPARRHVGRQPVARPQQHVVHPPEHGGARLADALPDGGAARVGVGGPVEVHEAALEEGGQRRVVLGRVEVAHHDDRPRGRGGQVRHALRLAIVARGVRRDDRQHAGRRPHLGAQRHPGVEPAAAPRQVVDLAGDDRVAAQDGRALGEAESGRDDPAQEAPGEHAVGGRGRHVREPQGRRHPGRDVAPPPRDRRLLERHHVGLERAQLGDRQGQPCLQLLVVAGERRPRPAVEQVEGDEPERAVLGARRGREPREQDHEEEDRPEHRARRHRAPGRDYSSG